MRRSARAIIIENGKLLAFERHRRTKEGQKIHYLSIPGGGIDGNETPEQAVVRELKEELLVEVKPIKLVAHLFTDATEEHHSQEHYFFLCSRIAGEPRFNLASDEARYGRQDDTYRVVWRDLGDMDAVPSLHPVYQPVMKALLPHLKHGDIPAEPLDIDTRSLV
ncbi:NUDIX hydrolase [candidate division TM7 genomosp. GTL1]|nr:NUDIX hydrolase [candidate division TM7 genomosp. GTL1]